MCRPDDFPPYPDPDALCMHDGITDNSDCPTAALYALTPFGDDIVANILRAEHSILPPPEYPVDRREFAPYFEPTKVCGHLRTVWCACTKKWKARGVPQPLGPTPEDPRPDALRPPDATRPTGGSNGAGCGGTLDRSGLGHMDFRRGDRVLLRATVLRTTPSNVWLILDGSKTHAWVPTDQTDKALIPHG